MIAGPSARTEVIGRTSIGPDRDVEVECVTLLAGPLEVEVLTYGAHLVAVRTPDRHGVRDNLVASLRDPSGRPDLPRYEDHVANPHLGAIVGRYANRIGDARIVIDGEVVELLANEGSNQLHGGPIGFDRHVWSAWTSSDERSAQVTLRHVSLHGDQGFPGTVEVQVRYEVDVEGHLRINLEGFTDATTVMNLTNHSYWNLGGTSRPAACDVRGHVLRVDADRYVEVDPTMIPTGQLATVDGTVFDLRRPTALGSVIDDPALSTTRGMDHCLVFAPVAAVAAADGPPDELVAANGLGTAELYEPGSGRRMRLSTDQPGVQVYTSNHGAGDLSPHSTVCLETQAFPDSPNQPTFPSTVLRPGERYRHRHHLAFSVDE